MSRFSAPIAEAIWNMKYRLKEADGTAIDATVEDTWRRVARALAEQEEDPARWEDDFYAALEDFKFLPAGRIIAGAGTGRSVTLFNCFVMGTIPDNMGGIFEMLKEAASVMTSRRSGPAARPCAAWRRMPRGRCPSWMSGIPCAVPSCRQVRVVAR